MSDGADKRVTMPVPNSPHLYRRVINVEPPPEREEDFESPMTKPPMPRFTSKFEAGRYTSGVEAFLAEEVERPKQTNFRKERFRALFSVKSLISSDSQIEQFIKN